MPPSRSKPSNSARIAAERNGQWGEGLAALFLRLKFYRLVDRRFKTPVGEIDLVMARGSMIVFVEVKTRRKAASEGETLEAVNQRRIGRAAQYWLSRYPEHAGSDFRFDVIFLAPGRMPRHVINAFPAS